MAEPLSIIFITEIVVLKGKNEKLFMAYTEAKFK